MSLLPEDAGFLEHVQAYFLAFRGDGVSLSPLDAELLADWKTRGVPYPVVCRGIRKAAEAKLYQGRSAAEGDGPSLLDGHLRTLRSCKAAVEREFRRWEGVPASGAGKGSSEGEGEASGAQTPVLDARSFAVKRLKKARKEVKQALLGLNPLADHPLRHALEAASTLVALELDDPRKVSVLIARADDTLALVYLRWLPGEARRAVMREARTLAGPRPERASRRARKDVLRAHCVALARVHGQLPALA